MVIKIMKLILDNINLSQRDASKIRGFITSNYIEFEELHNHDGDKYIYRYPLIQYKVLNNKPCIIGINDGIEVLNKISDTLSYIDIENKRYDIYEKIVHLYQCKFGVSNELIKYKFISPWMCLNEINFKKYININENEKNELLKKILIGNIISMSKGLKYTVNEKINVDINLKQTVVKFKNQNMLCFKGHFKTNFIIPNELGIGKSVSRGFGTVCEFK